MSVDYDRLETLLENDLPGPRIVDTDEGWNKTIVTNESGHRLDEGEQLRETARELLRVRRCVQRALKVLEQPGRGMNTRVLLILDEALDDDTEEDDK